MDNPREIFADFFFSPIGINEWDQLPPEQFLQKIEQFDDLQLIYILRFTTARIEYYLLKHQIPGEIVAAIAGCMANQFSKDDSSIVWIINQFGPKLCIEILLKMPTETAVDILMKLDATKREDIFKNLDPEEDFTLVASLHPEDAASIICRLKEDKRNKFINQMHPKQKKRFHFVLKKYLKMQELSKQIEELRLKNNYQEIVQLVDRIKDRKIKHFFAERLDPFSREIYQLYRHWKKKG